MAGHYPNSKVHSSRKRKWKKPVIIRIKLNPEQAVLTCCETTTKAEFAGKGYQQCPDFTCGTGVSGYDADT